MCHPFRTLEVWTPGVCTLWTLIWEFTKYYSPCCEPLTTAVMAPFHQLRGFFFDFLFFCFLAISEDYPSVSWGKKEIFHINRFYNLQFSYLLGSSVIGLARDSQTNEYENYLER